MTAIAKHAGASASANSTGVVEKTPDISMPQTAHVSRRDREILSALAARVREIAELPEHTIRKQRLQALNDVKPKRPIILCFPEGAWGELLPRSVCECENEKLRGWEWTLRSKIYWWENIHDDNTLEPYFNINWRVNPGNFGVDIPYTFGDNRGSYVWNPPLTNLAKDIDKLHFREPNVDREGTWRDVELAQNIFGDLLPTRIRGRHWWTSGLTSELVKLVGIEKLLFALYDDPENVYRLMAWLRDEHLNFIQWFEREGLLSDQNKDDYVGSGGVAYTSELPQPNRAPQAPARLRDLWGFGESQETVGVSPAMFEEFVLPYQLPLLEKFGLNCYGCCEPVHTRIDGILQVPRLRRVSVSPWADQQIMAEKLGKNIIFSRKPNPALVCVSFDENTIRADLSQTLSVAGEGALEIILKDTHTVQNEPWRITRWVQIALECVDAYMGSR